jgi:hypothetical protein
MTRFAKFLVKMMMVIHVCLMMIIRRKNVIRAVKGILIWKKP